MAHIKKISRFKDLNKSYRMIIELESYYKDMKEKYPSVNIWDEILEIVKKYKDKLLNNYEYDR